MVGQTSARQRAPGTGEVLSRRRVFVKGAAGLAVAGVGAAVLAEVAAPEARAAVQGTTVEPGAVAPVVVNLSDAATIAVDASAGNDFRVTIAGNRTMGKPVNPSDGEQIIFQVTQGTGGPFTITWDPAYTFSPGLPKPALSGTAGMTDLLGFVYNAAMGAWLLAAFVNGFS